MIDYPATDFAEAVRDVDVVLDPMSGDYPARSLRTLRPGGRLVCLLPFPAEAKAEAAAAA